MLSVALAENLVFKPLSANIPIFYVQLLKARPDLCSIQS
jgi:hypothetical protein